MSGPESWSPDSRSRPFARQAAGRPDVESTCVGHPWPRRPTGACQHAAARHTEPPSLHKYLLSMHAGQTLAWLCVYKMKRADPEPAPAELTVGGRGRHIPGSYVQGGGCCARGGSGRSGMPDGRSGESPGNNRAASLPAVRLQPSVTWEITRASGRSTSIGSKARTPQATSTASAITDSWHGSDEFPWKSTHLRAAQDVCKLCVYPSVSFKS